MSIQTMKQKTHALYRKNHSAPSGEAWITRGSNSSVNVGGSGFSINGGHRNKGRVGQTSEMSKHGTPFKGLFPIGYGGGEQGTFDRPSDTRVMNAIAGMNIRGNQHAFIKPSVLSTRGMLRYKYKWAYTGVFPNYWVQPNYTGFQTGTKSQSLYIESKAALVSSQQCTNDHVARSDVHGCDSGLRVSAKSCRPYVKSVNQPTTYVTHNRRIKMKCANPRPRQRPFPFAVQTGKGILHGGITVSSNNACNTSHIYYSPPDWYTQEE